MEIKHFVFNPLAVNTFVVFDDTKECVIVDCGCYNDKEKQKLKDFISKENLVVKHLICTHLHFDHIFGNKFVFDTYGVSPEGSPKDNDWLEEMSWRAQILGIDCNEESVKLGRELKEGDEITAGNFSFRVVEVPGHSQGGLMYYCEQEKIAFVGDTVFCGSIGRADLPGGKQNALLESIRTKVFSLPDDTTLMCGHGMPTTVKAEKENNPFFS